MARFISRRFQQWVDQRSPRAARIELNQRRIYILPTASGFFWLLMVLVIFLLAVNYQNSLAYVLCFFMLSLFLLSIIHTWRNLAGITLIAHRAQAVHAGEPLVAVVECRPQQRSRHAIEIGWPETETVVMSFDTDHQQSLQTTAGKRGWFKPGRMRIESVYPLGLCRAWSWVRLDFQALVYPAPHDRYPLPLGGSGGERVAGFDDFAGFRQYQNTDHPSHVFWKGYARTGELLTRQLDEPDTRELWFRPEQVPDSDIEQKLSVLTAWCLHCEQQRFAYGLTVAGQSVAPSHGALHLRQCLEMLALYEATP